MDRIRKRIVLSFTVFAMFFGAGNLIFPAFLSYQAGENILQAFAGFAATAIGFPCLALIAIGRSGSLEELSKRVHPAFSITFTTVIYLAIGPGLAIPRTASTSFEMVAAATSVSAIGVRIAYSAIFFALAALVAKDPEKLSGRLGKVLSPILLVLIAVLFIGTSGASADTSSAVEGFASHPLANGFTSGYQTMDAIAGLAFGIILAMNIREIGIPEKEIRKEGAIASCGGAFLLLVVYAALASIGCRAPAFSSDPATGADILSGAAAYISPTLGRYLIAAIFIIACFNTSVGLLSSTGEYFSKLLPSVSRWKWIIAFALISGITANAGLERIISISSPVLEVIYPGAIMLILLSFIPDAIAGRWTYALGTCISIAASIASIFGLPLPLSQQGFGWLIPAAAGTAIGIIMDARRKEA